jgi:hypothetical protein
MARVALVVGTGEYTEGFKPLPAAPKDVEAVANVLHDPNMGGFEVTTLTNPQQTELNETLETWFRERHKDDLALLYLSGHGIKDDRSELYFATCNTRKQKEELMRSTAVPANFVRDCIRDSRARRQIIILDCCFSGAFGDLLAKDDGSIDLAGLLGAEGRVVMTSSSSIQYSFEQRDGELSVYTHYLVEGIRTGAADIDGDGAITVEELHQYASRKVQEESPAMTPKIIVLKDEGYRIRIAKAPLGDPKVKYRKEVEAIVQEDGDAIDEIFSRPVLEEWQRQLGLSAAEAEAIEAEILEPMRQRQAKLDRYRQFLTRALQHKYPLGEREHKRLKQLQQVLGLLDENIQPIWDAIDIPVTVQDAEGNRSPVRAQHSDQEKLPVPSDPLPNAAPLSSPELADDLASEKGIDYRKLRDLLKSGKWKEADRETHLRMLETLGKQEGEFIREQELMNFPCADLQTIDRLWVKYSENRFGLSIQKQIYVECGAKLDGNYPGNKIWYKFCDRVGWCKNGKWLTYSALNPSFSSPQGIFPGCWVGWGWAFAVWGVGWGGGGGFLFSRIQACEL